MRRLVPALEALANSVDGPFFIQHGTTPLPAGWRGSPMLEPSELEAKVAQARVVITHGGPATISIARRLGRLPLVIPRRAVLGEHVDDHQLWYARRLEAAGEVILVLDVARLTDIVLGYPTLVAALPDPVPVDPSLAVTRFAEVIRKLLDQ